MKTGTVMQVQATINRWKRDRKVAQVVEVGRRLRALEYARSRFQGSYEEELTDLEVLDSEIRRLQRKHAKLIEYLKATAKE